MSISDTQINDYLAFAERLADAARGETLPRFRDGVAVSNKAGAAYDPVTDADRESERVQRELITASFPDHGIIGEEFGAAGAERSLRWVLDPVDGTRAFVCGVATWTTLIALEHDQEPTIGVIDQPFTDERWVATKNETLFRRGGKTSICKTSDVTDLSSARISTTDPRAAAYFTDAEAAAYARVAELSRIERFSLDAYGYAHIALGELDVIIESGLQHYDYAALIPVVEGAGGVITNWRGDPVGADDRNEVLAAATPALHAQAMDVLRG